MNNKTNNYYGPRTQSGGTSPTHECKHEEDWKNIFKFIGAKEATNGALKDNDNTLSGRLNRIEGKMDKLIFWMLAAMGSGIIALVVAIVSLIK